jgi:pectate lyase
MNRLSLLRTAPALPIAASLLALAAPAAHATTLPVSNAAAFDQAIAKAKGGDVIQLSGNQFPQLLIRRHNYSANVTIQGTPGATKLDGLVIKDSKNITVSNLTFIPSGNNRSTLGLDSSSFITVDHVVFNGRIEAAGAGMNMNSVSSNVTIRNSEFTNCGFGTRCFSPAGSNVTLTGTNFHDCYDCDFVRGGGTNVVITNNTFDRAQPGTCTGGTTQCPHDDLMQIMGGAHYQIVGNHFGARAAGAAQLFIASGLGSSRGPDDVYVANNNFDGGKMGYAIRVMNRPLPTNVRVVNNTVLTGDISSIRLDDLYARVAPSARPVVANNIFNKLTAVNCNLGQFSSNLIQLGTVCSSSDSVGDPNLNASEFPTVLSTLVLSLANQSLAPATDKVGTPRLPSADRGAFQHVG